MSCPKTQQQSPLQWDLNYYLFGYWSTHCFLWVIVHQNSVIHALSGSQRDPRSKEQKNNNFSSSFHRLSSFSAVLTTCISVFLMLPPHCWSCDCRSTQGARKDAFSTCDSMAKTSCKSQQARTRPEWQVCNCHIYTKIPSNTHVNYLAAVQLMITSRSSQHFLWWATVPLDLHWQCTERPIL